MQCWQYESAARPRFKHLLQVLKGVAETLSESKL